MSALNTCRSNPKTVVASEFVAMPGTTYAELMKKSPTVESSLVGTGPNPRVTPRREQ